MTNLHRWWPVFIFAIYLPCASAATMEKPIVLLIGLDGFRWDYFQKYHPPNLARLAADGVRSKRMIPSFPSLTFPNFYTLATGLHPEHHGVIGNSMFDPKLNESFSFKAGPGDGRWWGGEPIWVTAEKQGLRAACMFWPGSEAEIQGVRPSSWRPYKDGYPIADRLQTVLGWFAEPPEKRPRLITLYFHEIDTAGHKFGPNSPEVAAAVAQVDAAVGALIAGVEKLGLAPLVNYVIVSDHGMTEVSPERVVTIGDYVDWDSVQVDFSGAVAGLRPLKGTAEDIYKAFAAKPQHFQVWRREEMPERFHFRDHPRIPPVILVADEGWFISKRPAPTGKPAFPFPKGTHGYDPALESMGALFMASGPSIKKNRMIPEFENVQVYGLLCALLGLKPAANDGDGTLATEVLLRPPAGF